MAKRSLFKQLTLYSYRYVFGGTLLIAVLISLLVAYLNLAPAGLSDAVIASAIISANLDISQAFSSSLIDAPYHLLQQLSINSFGLSQLSITLPSIIIATITGIVFTLMIWRWFRLNIAIITGLIFVTSTSFLTLGRSGLPIIMMLLWISVILLAATNLLHKSKHYRLWQVIVVVAIALSLYTPLMIYPLAALFIAGLLHPHVRYLLRRIHPVRASLAALGFLVLTTPLIVTLVTSQTSLQTILGLNGSWFDLSQIIDNAVALGHLLLGVQSSVIGDLPKPFFTMPVLALAVIGFSKTVIDNYSARSYMIFIWLALLLIPLLLQPMGVYALVVPIFILVAIGVEAIIHEWYRLFPLNPYARLSGLIPLSILLVVVMYTGAYQYYYGHFYGKSSTDYHQALSPVKKTLDSRDQSTNLVTSESLLPFYQILQRDYSKLIVTTAPLPADRATSRTIVLAESNQESALPIERIVTGSDKENSVLMRIYSQD